MVPVVFCWVSGIFSADPLHRRPIYPHTYFNTGQFHRRLISLLEANVFTKYYKSVFISKIRFDLDTSPVLETILFKNILESYVSIKCNVVPQGPTDILCIPLYIQGLYFKKPEWQVSVPEG